MHEILNFAGSDAGTKSQHNNIVFFFIKRNDNTLDRNYNRRSLSNTAMLYTGT